VSAVVSEGVGEASVIIRGARLLDVRGERAGDVVIAGDRIAAVLPPGHGPRGQGGRDGQDGQGGPSPRVIDAAGKALIPGLVNAHTHAAMVLFRGFADDLPLRQWLEEMIWPLERHLKEEHVFAGTRLACLEMLTSGTTAFCDMYFFPGATSRAVQGMGMRAVLSQVFFDKLQPKSPEELSAHLEAGLDRFVGHPRISGAVGPHAAYTCTLEGLRTAAAVAERRGAALHFHLAETERERRDFEAEHGRDLVGALDELGALGPRLIAAHGIFLDGRDAERLAARGASVVHCPASNLKLASGWQAAPGGAGPPRALGFRGLRESGVNVALGTDGAASSNDLDMFQAMRLAALVQKHATGDPTALTAADAFAMATLHGARALGLQAGLIEPGYLADLVLLDLDRPYFCPGHDLLADLVYAAKSDCVHTVLVGGEIVLEQHGRPDARSVMADARAAALDLVSAGSRA
jgi:5-methylthioadenosine/S-adenosylhomocysteine deaminase